MRTIDSHARLIVRQARLHHAERAAAGKGDHHVVPARSPIIQGVVLAFACW